jgi:hypothetical protein
MLTVQYTGKRERTVGIDVVYPGELLQATPAMLAAWRAEHGDVFAVAGEAIQAGGAHAGAIVMDGSAAHAFGSIGEADAAAAQVRTKGRGK